MSGRSMGDDARGPLQTNSTLRNLAPYAVVAAVFVLAILVTTPLSTGDTPLFVTSVAARIEGRNYFYWDFGHLLWRPLGTLTAVAMGATAGSDDLWATTLRALTALNLASGLAGALVLLATMRRLRVPDLAASALASAFLLTHGVLSYMQSGTSYIPGLFFLIAGFYLAVRSAQAERWQPAACGAALAGVIAAGFWFPYAFVIPGLAVAAGVLERRRGVQPVLLVVTASALGGALLFIGSAIALDIRTVAGFIQWMQNSGHDISGESGIPRTLLGFGRSLVFVGDEGAVLRRFLHGDPYNPVPLWRVALTRIWLIGLVWLVGGAIIWQFVRARGSAMFTVFATAAIPIFLFAVFWQGGDVSRYFPLYPYLFLLLGSYAASDIGWPRLRAVVAAGLVIMAVNNVAGLSVIASNERREMVTARLTNMHGVARNDDMLYVSHSLDDVFRFGETNPLEPLVEGKLFQYRYLVLFGTPEVEEWRENFSRRVQRQWAEGHQVWIAARLLQHEPQPDWKWVESSDERVEWGDFADFFNQFEYVDPMDPDGFLRLTPTARNASLLEVHAGPAAAPPAGSAAQSAGSSASTTTTR